MGGRNAVGISGRNGIGIGGRIGSESAYAYDPYGQSTSTAGVPFLYTGHRYDAETGLYFTPARSYDPVAGEWISADPTGTKDGVNSFLYVHADPVNGTDPSGTVSSTAGENCTGSGVCGGGSSGGGAGAAGGSSGGQQGKKPPVKEGDPRAPNGATGVAVVGGDKGSKFDEAQSDNASASKSYVDSLDKGEAVDPTSPWLEDLAALTGVGRAYTFLGRLIDLLHAGDPTGLPPQDVLPPGEGPFTVGPSSRSSDSGKSLWDANGGEWRYYPEDKFHNNHWDYNPWEHPFDRWRNVPINDQPPVK